MFLHPGKRWWRPGPRVLGWRQLRQRCVPVSSLGFQTALPAPTPEHAYGPPCSFLLKHQQRKQTIKEGKVPLEQPPMTAIINVCKSKQLRLPLEQTTSSPRQHHSKGNYSKQNQRTCWVHLVICRHQSITEKGSNRNSAFPRPDAGPRVAKNQTGLVGTNP